MNPHKSRTGLSAYSMIELMIALGLLGIVILGIVSFSTNQIKTQAKIESDGDRADMRLRLLDRISCSDTLGPDPSATCSAVGNNVAIIGRSGTNSTFTLLTKNGTKVGRWTYRAECITTDGRLNVRAVRLKNGVSLASASGPSSYVPDPLTGKITTISDPLSFLFAPGSELCGSKTVNQFRVAGTYPSGSDPQRIELGGKPKYIHIYTPCNNCILEAKSCLKIASMPGWDHLCTCTPDNTNAAGISFDSTGFSVSGILATCTSPIGYANFVYEGYIEK